jgi:hypothetical protein
MSKDAELYCNCMTELLQRTTLIRSVFARRVTTGYDPADREIVFLQFRKVLELVAFGSLVANKDEYSKVRASFAKEWRAKDMLQQLEKVNPNFYPLPLALASTIADASGRKVHHLEPLTDRFLTKDDFVELYDYCGDFLHAQNPFKMRTRINVRLAPKAWLSRIEQLVKLHQAQLITGACWVCAVPDKDGKVHTYTAERFKAP